jgi:recombination protein RecT
MTVKQLARLNEDAPVETGPITLLRTQLEQRAAEFEMVLPRHISPAKFQRTLLTAAQTNPDLLQCDRRSLLTACMKAAQDGLLPDGREAAIVPFNTRLKIDGEWKWLKLAQYMPMVWGLRKKILQSEEVIAIHTAVVYRQELEGDAPRFIYREGSEHKLFHAPLLDMDFRPADADIALAYSIATLANGYQSFEVMRRYEIDDVRQASQTGAEFDAKGQPRDAKGPWVEWFAEMCKKTVLRRQSLNPSLSLSLNPSLSRRMCRAMSSRKSSRSRRTRPTM